MTNAVLVANRGEIAVRLMRGYTSLGVRTIGVYSDADADAWYVRLADAAEHLGPSPVSASYLNAEAVIAAAKRAGADAIDPGYGLLSESADFARAVEEAGLLFIGPPAAAIEALGNKVTARKIARRAGVPLVPGSDDAVHDADTAAAVAAAIGFPVLVKASFGGGGRGMRLVRTKEELAAALEAAAAEGKAAFGRGEIYLERAIERARHVEVQVLADSHGNVVHLGDRDCTVQRRHQKLIEEAPAPFLPDHTRTALRESAVRLAAEVGYTSTGTVEFLYDPAADEFYFLEMNTRLQVEHPVTELVTGTDLVAERLRVARGEAISVRPDDLSVRGHAIEARIAAEDPALGFVPKPGRVHRLRVPTGPWLRADFAVQEGDTVPAEYDSLYGKLIAWGRDREEARTRLAAALAEFSVEGVGSTAGYLRSALAQDDFIGGRHHTNSVEADWPAPEVVPEPAPVPAESATTPARSRVVSIATRGQVLQVVVPFAGATGTTTSRGVAARRNDRGNAAVGGHPTGNPTAPMDGVVVAVNVEPGQQVERHDVLFVIEAMKMQIPIAATAAGTVARVDVGIGASVSTGTPLATVDVHK